MHAEHLVDREGASRARFRHLALQKGNAMIVLGIILLVAGFLLHISILWTIGIVLVVIGLVLTLLGSMGRAVGGRRTYY